ncbi:MAG: hypothetical protein ILP23_06490 [Paludibacteraceae bacterium]|nr:hypothetical protein [Paludibacteraceae bacterium]MBP5136947.1 hypothetical protein [Paludibacteraceae bacterium]
MASNSIEFSINIDGTAYQGIAKISEVMNDLNVKVNKTQGAFKTLGDAAFRANAIADVFGKMSSAFSGIDKAGMDNEMLLMNMRTLYQGNAEAAQDMYDRIAQYGKDVKIYDKATLLEAQRTMTGYQIEAEKVVRYAETEDTKSMKSAAEQEYSHWNYSGYEGDFTAWLVPRVKAGGTVRLRDTERKEDARYYVTGVEIEFGQNGAKRKVKLGMKLTR